MKVSVHLSLQMMKGYNWEENESNMWPAMLFHGNIKAHIYKSANWRTNQQYHADIKIQSLDKLKITTRFLTRMSLLMMISNEKMQIRIVETFPTNLRMSNASWPKKKNQYFRNTASMCSRQLCRKTMYIHLQFLWTILIQYQIDQGLPKACT